MKSRSESLIRLKKFQTDEKRRQVAQIEMMIADFERMASELDQQIEIEQTKTGISDVAHFAYWAFAKAAMFTGAGLIGQTLGHDRIAGLRGIGRALPMTTFGLAFAGAIMLATLSFTFTQKTQDSTVLPPEHKEQIAQALEDDAQVMTLAEAARALG